MYIVTYNNPKDLHSNLNSIYESNIPQNVDLELNVINNYSKNFNIDNKFKVNILHNTLRPDWSTGHLSRNWNQAIVNGFGNVK